MPKRQGTGGSGRRWDATRARILRALEGIVATQGIRELSVQSVADEAGVTHRTIYRHFPTREAMLEGFALWLDERLDRPKDIESIEELAAAVEMDARFYETQATGVRAQSSLHDYPIGPKRTAARRQLNRLMKPLTEHLDRTDARAVSAVVQLLASADGWRALREQSRVSAKSSGRALAWAIDCLVRDLRAGGGPG